MAKARAIMAALTAAEDAFQSYLHDIRGLSLLSHEEEIILAKRSQAAMAARDVGWSKPICVS